MSERREQTNVRPDMAKLSDDSALLQQDNRTERQKLSDMNGKEKLSYIAEYYGRTIILVTAGIIIAISLLIHFLFQKDIGLAVLAVNTTTMENTPADEAEYYDEVLSSCGIDPDSVRVSIDSSIGVSPNPNDSASQSNIQAIETRIMAGSVDVLFSDEDFLYSLGEFDYLEDLSTCLPQEVLEKYADDMVYTTSVETGETYAVGIRLSDNAWIEATGWYEGSDAVIGIAAGVQNPEAARALVLTVLGEL